MPSLMAKNISTMIRSISIYIVAIRNTLETIKKCIKRKTEVTRVSRVLQDFTSERLVEREKVQEWQFHRRSNSLALVTQDNPSLLSYAVAFRSVVTSTLIERNIVRKSRIYSNSRTLTVSDHEKGNGVL